VQTLETGVGWSLTPTAKLDSYSRLYRKGPRGREEKEGSSSRSGSLSTLSHAKPRKGAGGRSARQQPKEGKFPSSSGGEDRRLLIFPSKTGLLYDQREREREGDGAYQ